MTPEARLRLVLDTNVLVAALRSRTGASFALLDALEDGAFQPIVTTALLLEYEAVLSRPSHRGDPRRLATFLDAVADRADRSPVRYRWRPQLPDADDEMVLEAAVNGRADAIVTFNVRDLRAATRFGLAVWTPADAMREMRRGAR